jgi:hypothetical protein
MTEMALWNVSGFCGCDSKLGHTVAVTVIHPRATGSKSTTPYSSADPSRQTRKVLPVSSGFDNQCTAARLGAHHDDHDASRLSNSVLSRPPALAVHYYGSMTRSFKLGIRWLSIGHTAFSSQRAGPTCPPSQAELELELKLTPSRAVTRQSEATAHILPVVCSVLRKTIHYL